MLRLELRNAEEPRLSAALQLTPEYVERLASGRQYRPPYSAEFPAQRLLDSTYSDYAVAKLGRFALQNPESKLGGCR